MVLQEVSAHLRVQLETTTAVTAANHQVRLGRLQIEAEVVVVVEPITAEVVVVAHQEAQGQGQEVQEVQASVIPQVVPLVL